MKKVTIHKGVEIVGHIHPEQKKVTARLIKCECDGVVTEVLVSSLAKAIEAIDIALHSGAKINDEINALHFPTRFGWSNWSANPFRISADGVHHSILAVPCNNPNLPPLAV